MLWERHDNFDTIGQSEYNHVENSVPDGSDDRTGSAVRPEVVGRSGPRTALLWFFAIILVPWAVILSFIFLF